MGHGHPENLSRFFVRRLYARGSLSIGEAVRAAIEAKEYAYASEGAYNDESTIGMFFECIVGFLRLHATEPTAEYPRGTPDPVIVPVSLTEEEERILLVWSSDDLEAPDDYFETLDHIRWKYAPGWRNRYPEIPILTAIEN